MGIDGSGEPVSLAHESEYDWDSLFREADIDPSQMDAASLRFAKEFIIQQYRTSSLSVLYNLKFIQLAISAS
eukprot:m.215752 g.215752  ORF g.215752 m.215752 type:complete len:72 (+) comp54085_c0_seq6:797-1012(+)